jgi:hypothetical protein
VLVQTSRWRNRRRRLKVTPPNSAGPVKAAWGNRATRLKVASLNQVSPVKVASSNQTPAVPVRQLLREIRELGYQGSSNLLVRYINQGRWKGTGRTCHRARPPGSCSPGRTASRPASRRRSPASRPPALR